MLVAWRASGLEGGHAIPKRCPNCHVCETMRHSRCIAIILYPLLYGISLSFSDTDPTTLASKFVGLENYGRMLQDSTFWISLRVTFIYATTTVLVEVPLAFGIALLLRIKKFQSNLTYYSTISTNKRGLDRGCNESNRNICKFRFKSLTK